MRFLKNHIFPCFVFYEIYHNYTFTSFEFYSPPSLTPNHPFHNLHPHCFTIIINAPHHAFDLGKVVQSVSLSPASLQVSQLQLQGLQAAGAQRAAEQLQEKRAGHHACQLVQQPLASCRGETDRDGQTLQRGFFLAVLLTVRTQCSNSD